MTCLHIIDSQQYQPCLFIISQSYERSLGWNLVTYSFNRFIKEVIKVMPRVIYYLIFSIPYTTFKKY